MKKILITGGLGFIGSSLVTAIESRNEFNITIIDRSQLDQAILNNPTIATWKDKLTTRSSGLSDSISLINEDLSLLDLDQIVRGHDVVFHLAANTGVQPSILDPLYDFNQNVLTTFRLLEAIKNSPHEHRPKLIFSSSVAPLAGNNRYPLDNTLPFLPLSPYGASKSSCECYIQAYVNSFGVRASILRFSNIYGPGSIGKTSVIAKMTRDAITSQTVTINGSGSQVRDFVYIDDLVDILIWSMHTDFDSPMHVCSGVPTSIIDIAFMIRSCINDLCDMDINVARGDALSGDADINYSSPNYMQSLNAPLVRPLSLERVKTTVAYFVEHQLSGGF